MARKNIDTLGISELKWTAMGEFNSEDYHIYYCGQESRRRKGVALIVNKRVVKAVLGYNLMTKEDSLEKTLMLGKCKGKRMRWMDSVIEATNMTLTQRREAVEDWRAWHALVHGGMKSQTRLND